MPKKIVDHTDKEARAYNWVLLATFVLLLSLVIQTPARVVANFLPQTVRAQFSEWGGSMWSGQVSGNVKGVPVQVRWQLQPSALLLLKAAANVELLTADSRMQGQVRLGMGSWQIQGLKGEIAASELQYFLSGWQLPNQPITLNNIALKHQSGGWQDIKGDMSWQGGALDYVLNGQRQHVNLPPVALTLSGQQNSLVLGLQEQVSNASLATFTVTGQQLESRLTQRLLSYSPNYHGVAEPDAVVVTASQPLSSL